MNASHLFHGLSLRMKLSNFIDYRLGFTRVTESDEWLYNATTASGILYQFY